MTRFHLLMPTLCLGLFVGCSGGDPIVATDGSMIYIEILRLNRELPTGQREKFDEASGTFLLMIDEQSGRNLDKWNALMMERFNGKTPRAIISEYYQLDRDARDRFAKIREENRKVEDELFKRLTTPQTEEDF